MNVKGFKYRFKANIVVGITVILPIFLVGFILCDARFSNFRNKFFAKAKISEAIIKVTYLYVGQGDATLIRDLRQGGKVMLIDGGPSEEPSPDPRLGEGINAGKAYIIPYLKKEGIKSIDYIVASHKDVDHTGGLPYVIRNFEVNKVLDNGTTRATPFVKDLLQAVKENPAVKYEIVKSGMEIPFGEGVVCQVLGPLKFYQGTEQPENNSSVVIRLAVGNITFMFPGDIEIPAELDILSYGRDIRTTVLKVPHHGSHSSSSKPFIDKVKPEVAVFSCGRSNEYGFPVLEIIRRYERIGSKIFRTDQHGNIEIVTDGKSYRVLTKK